MRVIVWLLLVNVVAFAAFGLDKRLAEVGGWRISERTLLLLALVGGTIGAIAAQHFYRHKTKKEPFRSILNGIAFLQAIVLAAWLIEPSLFSQVADFVGRSLNQI